VANYLITGGAGFIGKALSAELASLGHRTRVIDSLVPQVHGDGGWTAADNIEFLPADLRDPDAARAAIRGVDGVFHLAAEVGVGQSMYEIARYVGANDLGTAVLLDALIEQPVARIVVASSMSVYGEGSYRLPDGRAADHVRRRPVELREGRWNPEGPDGEPLTPHPTAEDKPVDLASIYALTKYAQERATMIFGNAYQTEAVALRLFNVFGPGQALSNPYTGVLANFGSRLASGQRPTVFEDGLQQRDFVHVRDVARAFCLAMEKPAAAGHVLNIGSGQAYTITAVAHMLAEAVGRPDLAPEILNRARSGDIRHCFADVSKAHELLGFQPEHRLEDELDELVQWILTEECLDRGAEMREQLETRGLVL
jgi:dTDP-L-rhamnose 4-epimerase